MLETARGPVAFYDIDTPVTLAKLERGDTEYLTEELIPRYSVYLSFTGGPTLEKLEKVYGSPMVRPLYCSFDPEVYFPEQVEQSWDLGYLGTYSSDRQPPLESLMLKAARSWLDGRFVIAGPQYPTEIKWPVNVDRIEHLPPDRHRHFYNSQRYTLNITRADMIRAGYSPGARLFEAAACGVPIISDWWPGLDTFFEPGREILIARNTQETLSYLQNTSQESRHEISIRARSKVLMKHTAAHRVLELEKIVSQVISP